MSVVVTKLGLRASFIRRVEAWRLRFPRSRVSHRRVTGSPNARSDTISSGPKCTRFCSVAIAQASLFIALQLRATQPQGWLMAGVGNHSNIRRNSVSKIARKTEINQLTLRMLQQHKRSPLALITEILVMFRFLLALPDKTGIPSPCVFDQSLANCYQQTDLKAILEIKRRKNKKF